MFSFLSKTDKALAPMTGKIIPIEEIPDEVFSGKILGDGLGIIPTDDEVYAPISGKITQLADTSHAVGIEGDNGLEMLLHLGIDTVSLNGEGFTVHCKEGDTIKAGDKLITMDRDFISSKGLNTVCCIILINSSELKKYTILKGEVTAPQDNILEYKAK